MPSRATSIGRRFLAGLASAGTDLRHATVDDVQTALEAMRTKADGTSASAATINTSVATVKSFLGFAHKVGFTRFNAAPLIKLKKAPRTQAQRLLSDVDVALLIRAAKPGRDRLLLQVALLRCSARVRAGQPNLGAGPAT
jgi:integrase/recombinase XerD